MNSSLKYWWKCSIKSHEKYTKSKSIKYFKKSMIDFKSDLIYFCSVARETFLSCFSLYFPFLNIERRLPT
jgi:hypothetical protein